MLQLTKNTIILYNIKLYTYKQKKIFSENPLTNFKKHI